MPNPILIAYATKYGATAEIAAKIGDALKQAGLSVEVLPADQVKDIAAYSAIVLGSAVYAGMWRKEAIDFLTAHEAQLSNRAVWLFSSGPTGEQLGTCFAGREMQRIRKVDSISTMA